MASLGAPKGKTATNLFEIVPDYLEITRNGILANSISKCKLICIYANDEATIGCLAMFASFSEEAFR